MRQMHLRQGFAVHQLHLRNQLLPGEAQPGLPPGSSLPLPLQSLRGRKESRDEGTSQSGAKSRAGVSPAWAALGAQEGLEWELLCGCFAATGILRPPVH